MHNYTITEAQQIILALQDYIEYAKVHGADFYLYNLALKGITVTTVYQLHQQQQN